MNSGFLSYDAVFANDNRWDNQAAIMLGRFIALHQFREKYKKNMSALAISPDFFFFCGAIKP